MFQFLLPVYPRLSFRVHIVLIDRVLVWECALHLTDVGVNFLTTLLINGTTDGPDHAKLEPQLYNASKVLLVSIINLEENVQ